jgi:exonuclease III
MVISEPGKKAIEQALTWGTHHISPQDSATYHKRTQLRKTNRENMKYLVYAAHRDKGDGEGGVVILLHEKWRHRVSKVKRHARGRWLNLTLMTPVGAVTIIGYYGRRNFKATPKAVSDWQDMQTKVQKCHAKGHTVIIAGDFNLSYNWLVAPTTTQPLIPAALNAKRCTQIVRTHRPAYTHRHGNATRYHTWKERKEGVNPVWTSPDHILISSTAAH